MTGFAVRLISRIVLEFQEGRSDKVYEVDLCEVSPDQCVVNFRYGRRGSTLKEGTKTSSPVSRANAEQLFENLVSSKKQKGYREAAAETAPIDEPVAPPATLASPSQLPDPRTQAILRRLTEGVRSNSRWKLSRAVWRAGEMRTRAAEPLLLGLLSAGDAMLDYSIAWSLGQLGSEQSIAPLRRVKADKNRSGAVRRIANVSLLQLLIGDEKLQAIESCYQQLPESIAALFGMARQINWSRN